MTDTHSLSSHRDKIPQFSVTEKFPGGRSLIQIHFWEAYILNRHAAAAKFLVSYSYDGDPLHNENIGLQRICFRFTSHVWFSKIKDHLIQHRIPVSIHFENLPKEIFVCNE